MPERELTDNIAALMAKLDAIQAQQQAILEEQRQHYRQVESLLSLYAQLTLNAPLPPMRGYAISPDFGALLLEQLRLRQPHCVVELGSGVSTLISGYTLLKQGAGRVISIDQSAEFSATVAQNLRQHQIESAVTLRTAPLKPVEISGHSWDWYDPAAFADLDAIDFLVIDGPAQYLNPTPQVRYPALPMLYSKLTPGAIILLDDADRADEQQVVERWLAEFDLTLVRDYSYETEKGAKLLQKNG
nr:hypothetical protein [uncultured bacterium]